MNTIDAILSRRTKRKFLQTPVEHDLLVDLVSYARLIPSAANMQPLKYAVIDKDELVKQVFLLTKWSGYVPDGAPNAEEQPPAYIAIFGDTDIKEAFETDAGAAGAVISLAAEDMGLSTCWLGAINKEALHTLLKLPDNLRVLYLIAVGHSVQEGRISEFSGDVKYFIDENNVLNVPKRSLDEILINI